MPSWDGAITLQNISLFAGGAANVQNKDWGAILTWTFKDPPYLASGPEILEEMITAYHAGAKYVVVFNYARDPETEEAYSILKEEHYQAMQDFWAYIHHYPKQHGQINGEVAYVLPQDYGWGMRHPEDSIWGQWQPDEKAPIIWENLNQLITQYGLALDIIYDAPRLNYQEKYSKIYSWNYTTN
ncbi:MAG: hypothetical protein ACOC6H_04845 [Thermoproteota archaeon]